MEHEWRRFILIGTDEDEKRLVDLISRKNLSKEDLKLILQTVKLNPDISQ